MELAKITSKGQITIPIGIRKALGLKNGDKVVFFQQGGKVVMENSSVIALREIQQAFSGEAERLGLKDVDDVVALVPFKNPIGETIQALTQLQYTIKL